MDPEKIKLTPVSMPAEFIEACGAHPDRVAACLRIIGQVLGAGVQDACQWRQEQRNWQVPPSERTLLYTAHQAQALLAILEKAVQGTLTAAKTNGQPLPE